MVKSGKLSLFFVVLASLLAACTTTSAINPGKGDNAQLANWPSAKTGTLRFISFAPGSLIPTDLATANVDATGKFSYNLPTPTAATPQPFASGCTFSPVDVKVASVSIIAQVTGASTTGTITIGNVSTPANTGDFTIQIEYVDKDWTISGTCTVSGLTRVYNIQAKAGFNFIIETVEAASSGTPTAYKYTASSSLPSNARWYYLGPSAAVQGLGKLSLW